MVICISVLSVIVLFAVKKRGWQTNLSLLTGDGEACRMEGWCGAGGGLGGVRERG